MLGCDHRTIDHTLRTQHLYEGVGLHDWPALISPLEPGTITYDKMNSTTCIGSCLASLETLKSTMRCTSFPYSSCAPDIYCAEQKDAMRLLSFVENMASENMSKYDVGTVT